ncbi:hypothetical protein BGY98DRAFT_996526 [Russula aff. rugulosa BPL654]|nr:hypothetical protein BGY98DRAFT_996526 [Russula aff. rugulosa BPL654]
MLRYSPLSMFYVPLIRTLRASSESVVLVTRLCIVDEENLMPVEEMMEEVPMRRALEYLPREKWVPTATRTRVPSRSLDSDISLASDSSTRTHAAEAIVQ